jgi:hypothetical protein
MSKQLPEHRPFVELLDSEHTFRSGDSSSSAGRVIFRLAGFEVGANLTTAQTPHGLITHSRYYISLPKFFKRRKPEDVTPPEMTGTQFDNNTPLVTLATPKEKTRFRIKLPEEMTKKLAILGGVIGALSMFPTSESDFMLFSNGPIFLFSLFVTIVFVTKRSVDRLYDDTHVLSSDEEYFEKYMTKKLSSEELAYKNIRMAIERVANNRVSTIKYHLKTAIAAVAILVLVPMSFTALAGAGLGWLVGKARDILNAKNLAAREITSRERQLIDPLLAPISKNNPVLPAHSVGRGATDRRPDARP